MSRIVRSTDVRAALRSRQRGFLLNPFRFGGGGGGDPHFANVSLLLHMDGSNGSTTITDSSGSPKTVTAVGGAQLSTAQSKFGGASCLIDASSEYLSITGGSAYDFGTGDFTVESWLYNSTTSTTNNHAVLCKDEIGGTRGWLFFVAASTGYLQFTGWSSGSPFTVASSTNFLSSYLNTWVHVAASRSGNDLRLFINGSLISTNNAAGVSFGAPSVNATIGSLLQTSGVVPNSHWVGHIDDVRVTKGVARYTATFTPPAAAFPDS